MEISNIKSIRRFISISLAHLKLKNLDVGITLRQHIFLSPCSYNTRSVLKSMFPFTFFSSLLTSPKLNNPKKGSVKPISLQEPNILIYFPEKVNEQVAVYVWADISSCNSLRIFLFRLFHLGFSFFFTLITRVFPCETELDTTIAVNSHYSCFVRVFF